MAAKSRRRKGSKEPSGLTPKQLRFVQEYLVDLNGTQAAIRAGYSAHTAAEQAARLLTKAKVSEEVARLRAKQGDDIEAKRKRLILELERVAFVDMSKFSNWGAHGVTLNESAVLTEDETRVVAMVGESRSDGDKSSSRSFKFKLHDKLRAIELLMRHHGMLESEKAAKAKSEANEKPAAILPWSVEIIGADGKTPEQMGELIVKHFDPVKEAE